MLTASYQQYILHFKHPSGTSRGVLETKETWFIVIYDNDKRGVGECGLFRGLSIDDRPDYESKLSWVCQNINMGLTDLLPELIEFPSIQFGLEMAFRSLEGNHTFELFPSDFTKGHDGIPINGLIWMGERSFMKEQIRQKIDEGFRCIKMKIGAIDFSEELELIANIRKEFSPDDIELRVDANGAFSLANALERLKRLSDHALHSIEQPIKQGQWQEMARLCEETPLAIALDEELIGIFDRHNRRKLLQTIHPQYIILKPSLIGGFEASDSWMELSQNMNIKWWITSALESNVGLNAIAQFTYTKQNKMPQGLGTGGLFTNNFDSPLSVKNGTLRYNNNAHWKFDLI